MNKLVKTALTVGLMAVVLIATSCKKDNSGNVVQTNKDEILQKVNEQFVNQTVIPTYRALADKSFELQNAFERLHETPTDENVAAACNLWKESRQYWEWSEAFLFGAAKKYYIDPHIDTWPLDVTAFNQLLNNEEMMADIENVVANLNSGLVGYHGVEYIIFRNGENRPAAEIPENELRYALAVSKDLTLSASRLEAAWAGLENVSEAKRQIIEDAEMEPDDNFGEYMRLCGQPGSIWKSITAGTEQIIEGCKTIADEVATSKIGKPYTGEDVNYVESPHSYNSIQDFHDNIISIRNVYFGGLGNTTADSESLSAYIRSIDKAADEAVINAINNSLEKIDAMPSPFVLNYTDPKVGEAITAVSSLNDALEAARKIMINN